MKKALMIVLALCAVTLLAPAAFAGVSNTRHDMATMGKTLGGVAARGVCSYCHVPHGAKGSRLWAGTPSTTYGVIANLCNTCHNASNSITPTAYVSTNMFNSAAHGYAKSVLTVTGTRYSQGNNLGSSALPYATDAAATAIECTSCHDVHSDTAGNRPFLRDTLAAICQKCHSGRDEAGSMAANATGSHVVGTAYDGSTDRPITFPAAYSIAVFTDSETTTPTSSTNAWIIGGHRIGGTSGGVTCATCHAVHGADPTNGGALPQTDVIINTLAGATSSPFCEDCHTANPGNAALSAHPSGATAQSPYAGSVTGNAIVMTPTPTWTSPSATYTGTTNTTIICVSCHDTHIGGANSPALASDTALVMSTNPGAWCQKCHTGTIITNALHHPANVSSPNYDTATFAARSTVGPGGRSALAVGLATTMDCMTCHRGHNAASQTLAGTAEFVLTAQNWDNNNAGFATSGMCIACHSANPSQYTAARTGATNAGSHFVSAASGGSTTALPGIQPVANAEKLDAWATTGATYTNGTGYSKYGGKAFSFTTGMGTGNTGGMLCESCHSVTNPRYANLVLGNFNSTATGNGICGDCHGIPTGTHATTGVTVSRTGAALNTNDSQFASSVPGQSGTTRAYYPSADALTCQSCHDVHDANTGGGGYILKHGYAAAALGTNTAVDNAAVNPASTTLNFTDLCAACHSSYR